MAEFSNPTLVLRPRSGGTP